MESDVLLYITLFFSSQSHYRRRYSQREYISDAVSMKSLHERWKRWLNQQDNSDTVRRVSYWTFRQKIRLLFPKLSLTKHVNDRCKVCLRNSQMTNAQRERNRATFTLHLQQKELARHQKRFDQKKARRSLAWEGGPRFAAVEFDFQSNLYTPCCGFSYYRYF